MYVFSSSEVSVNDNYNEKEKPKQINDKLVSKNRAAL